MEDSLAVGASMAVATECSEAREMRSPVDDIRPESDMTLSLFEELSAKAAGRLRIGYSPMEAMLSSECLGSLVEAEMRLSSAVLDEDGGILMLGLSMVASVCSVLACIPFLRVDEALFADKRVCELDRLDARDDSATFADPELEVEDTIWVRLVSSVSGLCSGLCSRICNSTVFCGDFSAIPPIGV